MKIRVILLAILMPFLSVGQCEDFDQEVSGADVTCYGDSVGMVTTEVTGGTGEITYVIKDVSDNILNAPDENYATGLPSGLYSIYSSDELGCEITDLFYVDQGANPSIELSTFSTLDDGDCTGSARVDTVFYFSGEYENIEFYWSPNPFGEEGIGVDSAYNLCSGMYEIVVFDENGCTDTTAFTIGALSKIENIDDIHISVVNNASGAVGLRVKNYFEPLKINIYDLGGQLVHSQDIFAEFTLLKPSLEKGTYVFTVLCENRQMTSGKFIVSD